MGRITRLVTLILVALAAVSTTPGLAATLQRDAGPKTEGKAKPRDGEKRGGEAKPRDGDKRGGDARSPREAERRQPPHSIAPPRPSRGGSVVFVGGYFYDPYYGPYPWWAQPAYPYRYYPRYDRRALLRLLVTPRNAEVYVDGFYAGLVNDFDGIFQPLPLPPGGHEIAVVLDGFRTIRQRLYLAPGTLLKFERRMEPLSPGEANDRPAPVPELPPPPPGTFAPPRTPRLSVPPPVSEGSLGAPLGTLLLRVQPNDAEVLVDGEGWASSAPGHIELELSSGRHRLEIRRRGYRTYAVDVDIREGDMTPLNISLAPEH